ncbi:hypothetical protein PBY51_008775 [Eleginops maclovinus]|uniref:Uncharacterized protein n=1 Tax=Eleginops maclovinus TaxID=56733 RepID=A0AAN7WT59_ELEMC|nr:hypothetical protein PBY51_008775 [Eleginops maclovinus]
MLCDQAWGSMLEVPSGSRLNLTGLGYLSCQSHTVMENNSYFFFLRMDENYNILPHGVNFQDAIFQDTTTTDACSPASSSSPTAPRGASLSTPSALNGNTRRTAG